MRNYRPVWHLIKLGKVVKHVMGDQLLSHCVLYHLIHPYHHGSILNNYCVTAVGHLQNTVTRVAGRRELNGLYCLTK